MFELSRHIIGPQDPGLPPSLLRDNSGLLPGMPGMPSPVSDDQVRENLNAAPWAKRFAANFIEPGIVKYRGQNGNPDEWVLLEADAIARLAKTLIGKPVIDWDHAEVWPEILGDGQGDGVVYDVWKDGDGWWHAGFVLWTKSSIEHAESGDWSVSCAYTETETDGKGGKYHTIDYTDRILDGVMNHLALVKNPRYEKARIRANSTEHGGYKMAWKLSDLITRKKEAEVLRLNAAEGAAMKMDVDGSPVGIADLVAKHNAASAPSDIMTCADDDEVEFEGKRYKAGDLKNSYRNSVKKNAEDKEKEEKEKVARENAAKARKNDVQLAGAGAEKSGKLAGAGSEKIDGVDDNPDKALEAGKEISSLKERLNSLTEELTKLKGAPSRELREAAHARFAPLGGQPEDQGFVAVEDRIRRGNEDFALKP
ncbi:MAG: DUF2213 domain-containing protein [Elusimicrobia bacterium]|nr:DUF2213 domain-containing protein [Elusimicrobiota bacterium]